MYFSSHFCRPIQLRRFEYSTTITEIRWQMFVLMIGWDDFDVNRMNIHHREFSFDEYYLNKTSENTVFTINTFYKQRLQGKQPRYPEHFFVASGYAEKIHCLSENCRCSGIAWKLIVIDLWFLSYSLTSSSGTGRFLLLFCTAPSIYPLFSCSEMGVGFVGLRFIELLPSFHQSQIISPFEGRNETEMGRSDGKNGEMEQ